MASVAAGSLGCRLEGADLLDHRLPQRLLASPPASSATASQPLPTGLDSDFGLIVAAVGTRPELTAATG